VPGRRANTKLKHGKNLRPNVRRIRTKRGKIHANVNRSRVSCCGSCRLKTGPWLRLSPPPVGHRTRKGGLLPLQGCPEGQKRRRKRFRLFFGMFYYQNYEKKTSSFLPRAVPIFSNVLIVGLHFLGFSSF
jgi:hypothetical protein